MADSLDILGQTFGDINRQPYGQPRPGFTGMMQGIMNSRDRHEQIQKWDAVANQLYKALTPEPDPLTDAVAAHPLGDPAAWKNASAVDRINEAKGVLSKNILQNAMRENKQREEAGNVLMNERYMNILRDSGAVNAMNRSQADEEAGVAALPQFAESLATAPGTNRLQDVAAAMKAAPNVARLRGNTMASQILERAMGGRDNANQFFNPGDTNFDLPGVQDFLRVPTGPNTSVLVNKNSGRLVPLTTPEGENMGYGTAGRSGVQPIRTGQVEPKQLFDAALRRETAARHALADTATATIPERKTYWEGELQSALADQQAISSKGSTARAASGGQANVTQEAYAKLKKGDTYWWNGKQLTKK
jgi:hypothetical protein